MIENILTHLAYGGVKTKKLIANETGNVILIAISKGDELKKHISNTDASILILEGELFFKINGQSHLLTPMDMFEFKKQVPHAIEALSDTKLILIK